MFTLIHSLNLEITFDTVAVEEQFPSVAFDITVNWKMPNQQAQILIKECWFVYSELNQFEENLNHLFKRQKNFVELSNMSLQPILQFNRNGDEVIFSFKTINNFESGTIMLTTEIDYQELLEILERIKTWAKWW
jgi:hypothetical protein